MEIELTDVNRDKKFGIGYSFTPTGKGTGIETPSKPDYTGTMSQCIKALGGDRTYQAHQQSAFNNVAWFYNGQRITATWYGWINDDEWQPGWVRGFNQDAIYNGQVKIRVG